jgi:rubrerythrin
MADTEPLKLSLLENSHAFLEEAVAKAVAAESDTRQWQFAILNLVQSLELSLKAALNVIHPVLVYENIDHAKNTVGPILALERLGNPKIGRFTFAEEDRQRIKYAVKVRNQMTHSDFELTSEYAASKFFEIFAFVSEFQRRHLATKVSDILPAYEFETLIRIRKLRTELILRAEARIAEEGIDSDFVFSCPNCDADTFVIEDGVDTCYVCSHSEPIVQCPHCWQFNFESDLQSFFDELDTGYEEGQTVIYNSYEYSDYTACPDCLPGIKEDIQNQRERDEFHLLEEEYYDQQRLAYLRGDVP